MFPLHSICTAKN